MKPESLNTTMPIRTALGWRSTKSRAAVLATSIRVGATSSAPMLPETSNARMTVPSKRGTPMTLCGRASESTRIPSPSTVQTAGIRRAQRERGATGRAGGPAAAVVAGGAVAAAAAAPPPRDPQPNWAARSARRRSRDRYSHTPSGIVRSSSRTGGQRNSIG